MPTFLRRRSLRKGPGPVERIVGPILLGVLALGVVAFLATTGVLGRAVRKSSLVQSVQSALGMSDAPLFDVDPADLEGTRPPRDRSFARAMLPDKLGDYERDQIGTIALEGGPDGDAAREDFAANARVYGARFLADALYVRQRPDERPEDGPSDHTSSSISSIARFSVWVADAVEPANAFGLCGARRPEGAGPARFGSGGWAHDETGTRAFWTGSYYFELRGPNEGPLAVLNEAAGELVSGRLRYGRPFWAERVLPSDDRRPDSFRYVRGSPLGIEPLEEIWLADYEDGVTLGVRRLDGPARDACLSRLRERYAAADDASRGDVPEQPAGYGSEEVAPVGYGAEAGGDEGVAVETQADPWDWIEEALSPQAVGGTVDGRAFVAWPQGPHLFVAAGPEPASVRSPAVALAARRRTDSGVADGEAGEPADEPAVGARFAETGDPDILAPTDIERYTDDVYAKINGREPHFRAYDFVELRVGMYVHTVRRENYEAFLFDMARPENALGIYQTERTGDVELVDIGRGGYVSGASVFFWKGRYYVYILGPADGDAEAAETARRIASAIADTIDDDGEPFWAEALLPTEGRIPGSLLYQAHSALGFEFLNDVFFAGYRAGETTYQLYLLRTESPDEARALFERYAEQISTFEDSVLARKETDDGGTIVSQFFGMFDVAFHKGIYYGGVTECDDREVAEQEAAAFRDSLPRE